jgi:hypothetical protein
VEALTDEQMTRIAEILKRQLRAATPETYEFQRAIVMDIHWDFRRWFTATDPDFLPDRFEDLIFGEYPTNLYG